MAVEITVPRLGWSMEEGVFVGWLKHDGDLVRAGEPLFTLEGDKAAQEIESLDAGILHIPPEAPKAGDTVAVGTVLGYLRQPDEPPGTASGGCQPPVEVSTPSTAIEVPRVRNQAVASPRARRVARELGIDWTTLTGTGRSGRVRERDVRAVADEPAVGTQRVPLSPVRKVIAERLVASLRQTAPVTLTTSVDATNLVNLREQFRAAASGEALPGYTDFLVKLTAGALEKHPLLNASWQGDHLLLAEGIHIGIAVDTEDGLLVPVVRDVPGLTLRQVAARIRELIERARSHRLTPEETQGGTFTLTNLGAHGIDAFTPIINPPQCAILGIGRIVRQPVIHEDRIVPRHRMVLSLTFDHRIVDGAPAARFLDTLRQHIEQPGPWLMP